MSSKSPSRAHGEGSIYRSDYTRPGSGPTVERWIASADLGAGANGKRLTHLEQNEGTKEEGTILRLRLRVERHIIPAGRIGGRQLDQLTVAQVQAWLRSETESGGKGGKPQAKATCRDHKQTPASSTPPSWRY